MKRLLTCFAITAFVIGCGQTTPVVTTAPKPTKPATDQTRVRPQGLLATPGRSQIVAHDGDKEANTMEDKSLTNDNWNYSSTSAQSAFNKDVDWLETDVILNMPTGYLYMQHSADCKKANGTTVNLMTAQPVEIGECAELFENQLDTIGRAGQWMIEIKGNLDKGSNMTSDYRYEVITALYNVLEKRNRLSTEIITSMDKEVLRMFKERADRRGIWVHLGRVYPLSLIVNGDNRPTKSSLDADLAQGFSYASAAFKDWTNENIDYAKKIGLGTMGWGWDDWWTGGRDPISDNQRGIDLCVDFLLTENIRHLKSLDLTCTRDLFGFKVNEVEFKAIDGSRVMNAGARVTGKACAPYPEVRGLDVEGYFEFDSKHRASNAKMYLDGKLLTDQVVVPGTQVRSDNGNRYQVLTASGVTTTDGERTLKITADMEIIDDPYGQTPGRAQWVLTRETMFTAVAKGSCSEPNPDNVMPPTGIPIFDNASSECSGYGEITANGSGRSNVVSTKSCKAPPGEYLRLITVEFDAKFGFGSCYISDIGVINVRMGEEGQYDDGGDLAGSFISYSADALTNVGNGVLRQYTFSDGIATFRRAVRSQPDRYGLGFWKWDRSPGGATTSGSC